MGFTTICLVSPVQTCCWLNGSPLRIGSELRLRKSFSLVSLGDSLRLLAFLLLLLLLVLSSAGGFVAVLSCCCCFWPYSSLWNTLYNERSRLASSKVQNWPD